MAVLVILGAGPGISNATAKLFAQKQTFSNIALLARNPERLNAQVKEVQDVAGDKTTVHGIPTDLNDFAALRRSLSEIEALGPLGSIFYNAARIQPNDVLAVPVEEIEEDFRTTTTALYVTAQWAIPRLQRGGHDKPSFLVTNSYFPERPMPAMLSLSIAKGSQQVLTLALREAFGKEIHFGMVKVNGAVSEENPNLNPKSIAEKVVAFYEEGESFMTQCDP